MGRRSCFIIVTVMLATGLLASSLLIPAIRRELRARLSRTTLEDRLSQIAPRVEPLWTSRLASHALTLDSIDRLIIVALKTERILHVVAEHPRTQSGLQSTLLASYPILAASGDLGPKLREGDRQVPEGFYRAESLNPNSRFHCHCV